MRSVFPLSDPVLWLRWLAAAALLIWLPGHLLVGRWLGRGRIGGLERLGRVVLSIAAGILLVPLAGLLFDLSRAPLTPLGYLAFALPATWALGRSRAHRAAVAGWAADLEPMGRGAQFGLLGCAAAVFTLLLAAHGRFCAPPHVHDAANHAFLVQRIAEAATTNLGRLFTLDAGTASQRYLPGWHAAAALCARLGGVAPYVSAWFLPVAAACLLPLSLAILWRAWRLPLAACVLGAALATANQNVPGGILSWGGLGLIVGFALAPLVALALLALARGGSAWSGVLAGLGTGLLAHVHASAVATAVILALAAPRAGVAGEASMREGRSAPPPDRLRRWLPWLCALAACAVVMVPSLLALDHGFYAGVARAAAPGGGVRLGLGYAIRQYVAASHSAPLLRWLLVAGVLFALADGRTRRPAVVSLLLGALYVALAAGHDHWSRLLATPFYGEAPRVLYLQFFFLPVLAALPLVWAGQRLGARLPARPRSALLAGATTAALLAIAALGYPPALRDLRAQADAVPFTPAEFALAEKIPAAVAPDSLVANFWDDGSTWAMQVSGRRFLEPLSWRLVDPSGRRVRKVVGGFLQRPWPPAVRELRRLGVSHLYFSDLHWADGDSCPATRALLDADLRFAPVQSGGAATLYRILWDNEPDPRQGPPGPGS